MRTGKKTFFPKGDVSSTDWYDWRWQYGHRLQTEKDLYSLLGYPAALRAGYRKLLSTYPFGVTPYYLSLVDAQAVDDPIKKQCFPDLRELDSSSASLPDPLGEEERMPVPGLVHRYRDRCLIMTTNACATYCRHCNRKRRWRKKICRLTRKELLAMLGYISRTPSIREVIISGGDPLTLKEDFLDWFLSEVRALPSVEVIRIGSRIPVVMPMRITKRLCGILRRHRPLWLNTQFNHVREITSDSAKACDMLLTAGIPLSNQSVLLQGVNDFPEAMQSLLYGLQRIGVRPYYLFHADAVAGTDHLRADISQGMELMGNLRENISGLCMPRYVLDTARGKIPLETASVAALAAHNVT